MSMSFKDKHSSILWYAFSIKVPIKPHILNFSQALPPFPTNLLYQTQWEYLRVILHHLLN